MPDQSPEFLFQLIQPRGESLRALRQRLHTLAEPSGAEERTAALVAEILGQHSPEALHEDLGGKGVLAWWDGPQQGPTVLLRAELDALPIPETLRLDHASLTRGIAHKCGHDGHMAILLGVAAGLGKARPARGRVVLLFQPAEETGQGGARIVASPVLERLSPHWVFALHNLPQSPAGQVVVREGLFASASCGLSVKLTGLTAHAAEPERGRSPALALAQLIAGTSALPQDSAALHEPVKATVVHARLGEPALGTTPGEAVAIVTLRAPSTRLLEALKDQASSRARGIAAAYGLDCSIAEMEPFPATCNHPEATGQVRSAAASIGLEVREASRPFPWSEDFGHFTDRYRGALFGLGAGTDHPSLHHPDYDFPDALLDTGVALFEALLAQLVGTEQPKPPALIAAREPPDEP